jgi:hypothetical protein
VDSIRLKLNRKSLSRSSDVERSWKARVHESASRTRDDALPYRFQLHVVLFISKASILVCCLHRNTICMGLKHCSDYNDDMLGFTGESLDKSYRTCNTSSNSRGCLRAANLMSPLGSNSCQFHSLPLELGRLQAVVPSVNFPWPPSPRKSYPISHHALVRRGRQD